jgi:ADP-ribosyl-[dinitrogen reductase] hydrolase
MALCLAESLIECIGFDAVDQMDRYVRWFKSGHLSSASWCFDIGGTTCSALLRFMKDRNPYAGSTAESSAGNGSIMRLAPVPLFFAGEPAQAVERAADSSRTTHGAAEAVDACRYLGALLVGAVSGASKDELLADHYAPEAGLWERNPLVPRIAGIASGSFRRRDPPEIRGTGYVVQSLEAALWAFDRSSSFCEGALMAVNLGDDADTTGAVFGQLAGAYYGESGIPGEWRERLAMRELIESFADRICRMAVAGGVPP